MNLRLLVLAALFLLAGGVRLASMDSSTLLGERQYRSALITRFYYYEAIDSVDPWKLHIARLNREREGHLEPPLIERGVAFLYRLAGGEHLWIPRGLSVLFWLLGGVFLYHLALRFVPPEGAVIGTAYYLLNPLGVSVSVGFLPDPLMIALFILSLLVIVRFHEHPNRGRLGIAAAVSGLAVLVKPFCLFAILGAIAALAVHRHGLGRQVINRSVLILLGAALAPAIGYYGYGMLIHPLMGGPAGEVPAWDSLARSASVTFVPQLLLDREFWIGWVKTALYALGPLWLIGALIGIPLLRDGRGLALVAGLLGGYVVFGLTFTYLTPFAGHYHLQLIVVVALGIGGLAAVLIEQLRSTISRPHVWAPPIAAGLLVVGLTADAIRRGVAPRPMERVEVASEVGRLIGHSDRTVHVATFYGKPLQYHGEFYGTWWPSATGDVSASVRRESKSIEARLESLGFEPEYFVITDFTGYERRHADLRSFLEGNCRLLAGADEYLIYSECARELPSSGARVSSSMVGAGSGAPETR